MKLLNAQLRPKRPPRFWDSERHIKPKSTAVMGLLSRAAYLKQHITAILSVLRDQGLMVISLHSDH